MNKIIPFLMLILRPVLFLLFQSIIAIVLLLNGYTNSWNLSQGYWIVIGLLANIITYYLLFKLFKKENYKYWDGFKFDKNEWWKDLLIVVGALIIIGPFSTFLPKILSKIFWGNELVAYNMFFREIPLWIIIIGFAWPITQGIVELPLYFLYAMPRINKIIGNTWIGCFLASFFLSFQHISLPMIFDIRFICWRFGMFFLFAFIIGLLLKLRPKVLPYLMIAHALIDIPVVIMLLQAKKIF